MRLVSRIICSIFIFSLLICFNTSYSQDKTLEWKLFHTVKKGWIPAGTCGAVQEILIKTNELPDPFVGTNEKLFQWIESLSLIHI
jgi:beta-mannosidase